VPVPSRLRDQIRKPVEELKHRELDDAAGPRVRLLGFSHLRCRPAACGIDSITRHPGMIMLGHHDNARIDRLRQTAAKKGRVVRVVIKRPPSCRSTPTPSPTPTSSTVGPCSRTSH
jgi:hypothetical protein